MTNVRRPAAALIDAIVDNMRQNLEELKYATLAPSRYTVYLSAAELARLEGLIPRLKAEAVRALDEELAKRNRPSWLRRQASSIPWLPELPWSRRAPLENAAPKWHIEFLPDTDGDLAAEGDIIVHSDLLLAPDLELGVGERTRRITTVRMGNRQTTTAQVVAAKAPATSVHARLVFEDNLGRHEHDLVNSQTSIGRGGAAFPVDVRISTSEDVSREHARIRRDERTGQFFLIDVSSLGTTLNGRHVPRGAETETSLPARARIGLADTVFLDFEQVQARDEHAPA